MGLGNGNIGSPTAMHQKLRAIGGIPTPFAASTASPITQQRLSNPPTPTQQQQQQQGRPEFIGLSQQQHVGGPPLQQQYPSPRPMHGPPYYDTYNMPNGEQRRILSEGELMYDRQYLMSHDQSGGVVGGGPIRELASSPQRGVYMWKDNSPTSAVAGNYFHSNPTSPIQHNLVNNGNGGGNRAYMHPTGGVSHMSSYNPNQQPKYGAGAGGMNQVPLSPSGGKKKMYGGMGISATVPNSISDGIRPSPISRRPMSFVRALEMTDSLEMSNRTPNASRSSPAGTPKGQGHINDMTSERSSIYDTNYEISV